MAKLTAKVDTRALLASIKKEAAKFGESTRQATARMGLQAARELSGSTQAFGKSWAKTQEKQRGAIAGDMLKIFVVADGRRKPKPISSVQEALETLDANRKGKGMRTRELATKIPITQSAFTGAMMAKFRRAGMGKSAWIGTARHLQSTQGKGQQIRFGKAYTSALRAWERLGKGTDPKGIFKPTVELHNTVKHTGTEYVLSNAKIRNAQKWAVSKTLKWYEKATTANLAKNK